MGTTKLRFRVEGLRLNSFSFYNEPHPSETHGCVAASWGDWETRKAQNRTNEPGPG